MDRLAIKDVAALTGIAAGTIRMWEQRFGFPSPARTESGYRSYTQDDVDGLRRVVAFRARGLSVPSAIDRARETAGVADHPSIYAAVVGGDPAARPQVLRKSTLIALSRAIEHETIAHGAEPLVFASFQRAAFYRPAVARYRELARLSTFAAVFADFAGVRRPHEGPYEIPIGPDDALGNEWTVIVDAPGYCASLLAWEHPNFSEPAGPDDRDRRFEAVWTLDPYVTRKAATVASQLVGRADPALGRLCAAALADRPLALDRPAPSLTALSNRMVAYLEAVGR